MSHFVTDLEVRLNTTDTSQDKRGTWTVIEPFIYFSDLLNTQIIVPDGFVTDFASVPRIPVAFLLAGDTSHAASVIHDWLYCTHDVDRAMADDIFKEACMLDDPSWRAWLMWVGVRLGGSRPYEEDGQKQVPQIQSRMAYRYGHPRIGS